MTDPAARLVFPPSKHPYVGIEREFNFVAFATGEVLPIAPEVIAEYKRRHEGDPVAQNKVAKEIHKICIEVISKIGETVADAVDDTETTLAEVREIAAQYGATLLSIGNHPSVRWEDLELSDDPRMHQLRAQHGITQSQWTSLGTHVHVGMPGPEEVILVDNITRQYLPHMLAMTASSPFSRGRDTHVQSSRELQLRQIAMSGLMPPVRTWEEYERVVAITKGAGWINILADLHPLSRKSVHGTLEYRIPEAVPTMAEVSALAAFAQCVAVAVITGELAKPAPLDMLILNSVEAVRERGYDAKIFVESRVTTVREHMTELLPRLKGIAEHLNCSEELASIPMLMNEWGNPAQRQRDLVASLPPGDRLVEYANGERSWIDPRTVQLVQASVIETLTNSPISHIDQLTQAMQQQAAQLSLRGLPVARPVPAPSEQRDALS